MINAVLWQNVSFVARVLCAVWCEDVILLTISTKKCNFSQVQ
jgi:hypothetical protein